MYIYLVILALLISVVLSLRRRKYKKVPGPKGWPVIGMLFDVDSKSMYLTVEKYAREHGEIVGFTMLGKQLVFLNSERAIRKAFEDEPAKYLLNDRPETYVSKAFYHGKSMVMQPYGFSREHDLLRKWFAKGLHVYGDGINVFEERVRSEILNLIRNIDEYGGAEFEVPALIKTSIANLMSILLRGHGFENNEGRIVREYIEALDLISTPKIDSMLLNFPFLRHLPGIYKRVHEQFRDNHYNVVNEFVVKQKTSYNESETRGIVDFLLHQQNLKEHEDDEKFFSDERIEGITANIVLAGVSTSVPSLSSMILCLAHHPEVQRKAQQEIQAVIGNNRFPALQDKAKCPYIEALFMESQRYITVAPFAVVHTNREQIQFEGFDIPKKSLVFANLWFLHHNEKVWGDPWTFRPERFLNEKGELLPRTHPLFKNFLPFGVGRRQCAGEGFARSRIFLYIASLLQRWTFIPSRDRCGPCDPRSDQFEIKLLTIPKPFFCRVVRNCAADKTT